MRIKAAIITLALLVTGFIGAGAIATGASQFEKDAVALCEVYNPDNWKDYPINQTAEQVHIELGDRIAKAIKTKEFKNIFESYINQREVDFYTHVTGNVSKLLKTKWQCKYFDAFYGHSPRKEYQLQVIGLKEVTPAADGIEVIISVDQNGTFYVNDNPLVDNHADTLQTAIKIIAKTESPVLVYRADSKAPHQAFVTFVEAARNLRVKKISIETQ